MKRQLAVEEEEDLVDDDVELFSGGGSEKKRRLSCEQVRALEKSFELENKLEPERKVKLAHQLGLQPRQVAVWFQNRRARWKTKQLERDYAALKASYDALRLEFDGVRRDKDGLLIQIKELKAKLADDESLSFSSVKEEPIVSEDDDKEKLILENSDELPPLIYGTSTDSDSSAVLNDMNHNSIATHWSSDRAKNNEEGFAVLSSGSSGSLVSSSELNSIKFEGNSSIYDNFYHMNPILKIEENEFDEEPCSSIFTEEQAPSLNWYYSEHCWD